MSDQAGNLSGCEGCVNEKACAEGEGREKSEQEFLLSGGMSGANEGRARGQMSPRLYTHRFAQRRQRRGTDAAAHQCGCFCAHWDHGVVVSVWEMTARRKSASQGGMEAKEPRRITASPSRSRSSAASGGVQPSVLSRTRASVPDLYSGGDKRESAYRVAPPHRADTQEQVRCHMGHADPHT